ncbi:MAG: ATP/GTP-binding protein, partial [Pseudonocardiales bacterium]|nr:ATP/GTP-binding protein [Pseudonocardiales bacterium]
FGSYAPDEVGWLLSDLSATVLEAPTEEREEAVQSGGRHYAESLPIEYVPSPAYSEAFEIALQSSADAVAQAVGVVAELIRDARGDHPVLVSLARAGTPVGILLRRWWKASYGIDLDHYAVSIVRGRGIDATAMRWLAAHHDPAQIMFVDGWTGKGAIVRELTAALDAHAASTGERFSSDLAVLADPGGCVSTFGTREDFLIPSACLNSTVSGLVSRTVLNDRLLSPGSFHGAKFYRELAPADVSGRFLDAITARFDAVRPAVAAEADRLRAMDRSPTWAGWAAVEEICVRYGIDEPTLVKPGIGESTRVLLRRVPWRVLVRASEDGEVQDDGLRHVLLLARDRGVPIEQVPGLPYRCVGLIHPKFTRGATGADGLAT